MIKLLIIGNLGADAVIKEVGGSSYISYSVCHTERSRDGKEFSTWVNVMQKTNDSNPKILPYLTKGTQVYVEGNPSAGAYVDGDGKARASLSLWSFKVDLLGSPRGSENASPQEVKQKPKKEAINYDDVMEDDSNNLPF